MIERLLDFQVKGYKKWVLFLACLAFAVVIGLAEIVSPLEYRLTLFYLLPIMIVSWYLRLYLAVLLVGTSTINWLFFITLKNHHTMAYYWNLIIELVFLSLITILIRVIKKQYVANQELSLTDQLTGLTNRRGLTELSHVFIATLSRNRSPISLIFFDLDNFKTVNDTFGHKVGDTLLVKVARALHKVTRRTDIAARLGGDEFVLLLPNTDKDAAIQVQKKLQTEITRLMKNQKWPCTLSAGIITTKRAVSLAHILQQADRLMYNVKKSGKNAFQHKTL